MLNKLCRHGQLKCQWNISRGVARVSCKQCGFSVEVTGEGLNEAEIKIAFNEVVQKKMISYRIFSN